jgi:hypothetical protein
MIGNTTSDFWLSGTDLGSEGYFYWAGTGQPLGLFSDCWMPGMPDNFRNKEHCLQFKFSAKFEQGLLWNDNLCEKKNRFICELMI